MDCNGCTVDREADNSYQADICTSLVNVNISDQVDSNVLPNAADYLVNRELDWDMPSMSEEVYNNVFGDDAGSRELDESVFEGFQGDETSEPMHLENLNRVRKQSAHVQTKCGIGRAIQTRSRGPVNTLPNVQRWTLERRRRKSK